jgi:hypothetical protein
MVDAATDIVQNGGRIFSIVPFNHAAVAFEDIEQLLSGVLFFFHVVLLKFDLWGRADSLSPTEAAVD